MVERCTAAREGDLWAFFDDKHELCLYRNISSALALSSQYLKKLKFVWWWEYVPSILGSNIFFMEWKRNRIRSIIEKKYSKNYFEIEMGRVQMAAGPSDDSDSSGSGKSGKQPRRIQTFHGITSETRESKSYSNAHMHVFEPFRAFSKSDSFFFKFWFWGLVIMI